MGPKSLAFRLVLSALVWVLVVVPATALLLVSLYRGVVEHNFDARLNSYLISLIASSTGQGEDKPAAPAELGFPPFRIPFSGWYWQIKPLHSKGAPLYVSDSLLDQQLTLPSSTGTPPDERLTWHAYRPGPEGQHLRVVEREIHLTGPTSEPYSYAVAGNAVFIDRDLTNFTNLLIAALVLLSIGLVAATIFQVRYGLMPLRAVRQGLAAIRSGKAERLEGDVPDEIKPLQTELNALIQSNREVVERARTHVGNLAHALKTPLSVISNEARARRGPFAKKVLQQAEIMHTQITHHLDRARVAARSGVIGDTTDVDEVLRGLKRALDKIHEERSFSLDVSCATGLKFQGEKQDLEEMAGNLMDNACKWCRSTVKVSTGMRGAKRFVLTVDDDGPGLAAAERARAVRRGQRLDESKPGSGLGLSIVAELAHLYKGSFKLLPSPLGGLRAQLILPAV